MANLADLEALGYNFVSVGADVVVVTQYVAGIANALSQRSLKEHSKGDVNAASGSASIYGGNAK